MSEQIKAHQDARKAAGLCIECGVPSDRTRCVECRKKNAEITQRRRDKKKADNACMMCGGQRDSEKKMCSGCVQRQSAYAKKSYDKHTENKKCVVCGRPTETNLARCVVCNEATNRKEQRRRARYTADGRCRECGAEAQLSARSMRGKDRGSYCRQCFLKRLALTTLGSMKHWQILVEKLDACGWRCPYTGEPLVLGDNLSFDHMDPIARFPERQFDPDNVEPISWQINLMKRDMTKSEFLALIDKIHTWRTL